MEKAKAKNVKFMLPVDTKVGNDTKALETADDRFAGLSEEDIISLSMKFGEEMKRRCLRSVWDPRARKFILGDKKQSKIEKQKS